MKRSTTTLRLLGLCLIAASLVALGAAGRAAAAPATSTTTLSVSPTTINVGDPVTLTATVTSTTVPTGSVQFTSQQGASAAVNVGAAVALVPVPGSTTTATATLTTTSFSSGTYAVGANYKSASWLSVGNSSAATTLLAVGPFDIHNTQTTLAASSTSIQTGQAVTFTATVATTDGSGIVPSGVVTFSDGSTYVGEGTIDPATGTAQITVTTFTAGSHHIIASYQGDIYDNSSGASIDLTVADAVSPAVATTTSVDVSPGTINAGDNVTISAHVAQSGTQTPPKGDNVVTFTANGVNLGEAPVDANGDATLTVDGWITGTYDIKADYVGNIYSQESFDDVSLSVVDPASRTGTTLTLTGATTAAYDDGATLAAKLVDANDLPVAGETVTLSAGSQTCTATTGADGTASCAITVSQQSGPYTLAASFAGDAAYGPASTAGTFTVTPQQDTLAVAATISGATSTLTGTLLEKGTTPIAGRSVVLTFGSGTCSAATNANGVATCTVATPSGTSATLTGSFGGDPYFVAASATKTVPLSTPTTLAYTGSTAGEYSDPAKLSATLSANGAPLAGKTVTLTVGTQSCVATTDATGVASCRISPITQPGGATTVTASFAGDATYGASTATAAYTIAREDTTLLVLTPRQIQASSAVTLTGILLYDGFLPLAGKTVTLTLGSLSCTATTGFLGVASCDVDASRLGGTQAISASFAGDAYFAGDAAQATAVVSALKNGGKSGGGHDGGDDEDGHDGSHGSHNDSHGGQGSCGNRYKPGRSSFAFDF